MYIASGGYGGDSTLESGVFRALFELTKLTTPPSVSEYPLPINYYGIEEYDVEGESRKIWDVDGDGEKELCLIYAGPTSGVLTYTIVVQELGVESYLKDGIYTICNALVLPSFIEGENGELYVKNDTDDVLLKVTVNKELNEVSKINRKDKFELYHSTLIMYNPTIEKTVIEDTISGIDIVPTIYNLYGLDYDSRIYMGRDIFSKQEHLVILSDRSWITKKGRYNSVNGKFTKTTEEELLRLNPEVAESGLKIGSIIRLPRLKPHRKARADVRILRRDLPKP